MAWQFTPYSVPPLLAAFLAIVLVAVARRHEERPIVQPFIALMIALAGWSVLYAGQVGFTDMATQLFWWRAGICLAACIPPLWLLLTIEYAGADELLDRGRLALLAAEPAVFAVLVWTDPFGGIVVREAVMRESPRIVDLTLGVGYLIHIAWAYVLVATGIVLLFRVYAETARIYRKQAGVLIGAAVVPLGANVAFTTGVGPIPALDLTTFAFTVTGALMGLALFRLDLLDRSPVAHESVIEELGDGIVVFDEDGTVVDVNDNARRIVGDEVAVAAFLDDRNPVDAEGAEITARVDGSRQVYQGTTADLEDFRGEQVGTVLALRDVTHRHEYEQRLEVTNRILRHNLRNEANVIHGHAALLAEQLSGEAAERARTIREMAMDLAHLSEKAEDLESTLAGEEGERTAVDVAETAERVVARTRGDHPTVDVSFEAANSAYALVPSAGLLETALSNLIENAIEHNPEATPRVSITVTSDPDAVRLVVEDNGPGIPDVETRVLEEGHESALEHGSGLGLWLVHWVVSAADGEVSFDAATDGGSVVELALPAAERGA